MKVVQYLLAHLNLKALQLCRHSHQDEQRGDGGAASSTSKKCALSAITVAFCLGVMGTSTWAASTYTWNQTGSAAWTTPGNWTPDRTTPATDDILVFNNGATT